MALRVNDSEIFQFAEANDRVASEVEAGCQPDPDLIAQMEVGYGPCGADFTAAVADFQVALHASGRKLAQRYHAHSDNLRAAATAYNDVDQSGAEGVSNSASV